MTSSGRLLILFAWTLSVAVPSVLSICGKDDCICTLDHKPVCGSDGKTYGNQCLLNCHNSDTCQNITVAHEGKCEEGCACIALHQPVCGSDNKTYGNSCEFACQNKGKNVTIVSCQACNVCIYEVE